MERRSSGSETNNCAWGYTRPVRIRGMFAFLLSTLLLALSFVNGSCEVRCELRWAQPGCHRGMNASTSEAEAMPAGHACVPMCSQAGGGHGPAALSSCSPSVRHRLCYASPALVTSWTLAGRCNAWTKSTEIAELAGPIATQSPFLFCSQSPAHACPVGKVTLRI